MLGRKYCNPEYRSLKSCWKSPFLANRKSTKSRSIRRISVAMAGWQRPGLDPAQLEQYLVRIGASEEVCAKAKHKQADLELLSQIVGLQVRSVPFENLNLMYQPAKKESGGQVKIDLESLVQKIVTKRRGGYCFEVNELLAQALTSMGFDLYTAAGRIVVSGTPSFPGEIVMTRVEHELILVRLENQLWVCDAGQGSSTPIEPVLLTSDLLDVDNTEGKGGSHRVRRGLLGVKDSPDDIQPKTPQREGWYMQKYSSRRHQWSDVYFFTEQEWQTADYDVPNLWCSHNHTLFSKVLVVALHTGSGRKTIEDMRLRIYEGDNVKEENFHNQGELTAALEMHFGLRINESS